ncbi:MAG: prolyl oligopeptidase family serine peptidase [Gemmatimonadales bacterium]
MRNTVVRGLVLGVVGVLASSAGSRLSAQSTRPAAAAPTIEQFLSFPYPSELVSARKADRIAWLGYDRGQRNVYTAAAPGFKPVRLTRFLDDNGIVLSDLEISDDGSVVTFVRGSAPNREGWIANPSSDPAGPERSIWVARTNGTGAWMLADGSGPRLSPNGRAVAFVKEGQIYRLPVIRGATTPLDKGELPLIKEWGENADPRWSPDGTKIAYVSQRENHDLIGVYDVRSRRVYYVSPSVDHDMSPTWSPDGKRLAFVRRPGTPFGQQVQAGDGSIGSPAAPGRAAAAAAAAAARRGGGRGRFGTGPDTGRIDGLYRAAFTGGYTISFMVADIAGCPGPVGTCEAHEFWHNQAGDRTFPNVNAITWAGRNVIFQQEPQEWIRIYSVAVDGAAPAPIELTPGEGAVETTALSRDGATLFYATNAGDIERRHIWKVPTAGGSAEQITNGTDYEMYPAPLGSGTRLAVLSAGPTRPLSVGLIPTERAETSTAQKLIYPTLPKEFPAAAQVVPTAVVLKAEDGVEFHNQLFLPKDLKPGERRPAMVFVHGGPIRQMMLGYHYMDFYATAYAVNEWLASQGYVVISVNYRSGIGYGKSFRMAPNTGARGNSEYRDVIAAGRYLQTRADVDPGRIGIWGLSYGGILTAQALAHNSDVFVAGVDMAGVHLRGTTLDTADVSYQSSAISAIDTWKSPVLLWQGDDDRNVAFSQTIGLVDLLRAHNVYHELIVVPDDTHETLIHKRWLYLFGRMQTFLTRFVWDKETAAKATN